MTDMNRKSTIVSCPSCEGYGWFEDEIVGEVEDCDWCTGVGYIYRDANGIDSPIPASDWGRVADQLEKLEAQRLQDMGYTGSAKKPWEQAARGAGADDSAE